MRAVRALLDVFSPDAVLETEATRTSGAKMQARLALEHGKRVFLLRSMVTSQAWARDYVGRRALEVESADLKSTT
jgi:predicted Rossmann fold nucleotide-binding protein DprA/Smf involved in DNA uptake